MAGRISNKKKRESVVKISSRSRNKNIAPYRSSSEKLIAESLQKLNIPILYETEKIKYQVTRLFTYTPDFLLPNGIYIEVKGWFKPEDRAKHLAIRKDCPFIDIRFIFDNPNTKLNYRSKLGKTYAEWCQHHGFLYCKLSDGIPREWLEE